MADKVFPAQTVRSVTASDVSEVNIKVRPDGVVELLEIHYALHRQDGTSFKNGVFRRAYNSFGAPGQAKLDAVVADAVALLQAKLDAATSPDEV